MSEAAQGTSQVPNVLWRKCFGPYLSKLRSKYFCASTSFYIPTLNWEWFTSIIHTEYYCRIPPGQLMLIIINNYPLNLQNPKTHTHKSVMWSIFTNCITDLSIIYSRLTLFLECQTIPLNLILPWWFPKDPSALAVMHIQLHFYFPWIVEAKGEKTQRLCNCSLFLSSVLLVIDYPSVTSPSAEIYAFQNSSFNGLFWNKKCCFIGHSRHTATTYSHFHILNTIKLDIIVVPLCCMFSNVSLLEL